ncbi:hypothetical protein FE782_00885 [Paenibacillus antri]|uniref:Uncharacterized protein n=1 Tax=Paenibacillus antri TaxID=2582848 RepID=A0A5R9GI47_9BACL|nr:hypothetical protein [Paenibacillus antri]TLS53940.1 hypothetical protein FE782_00885 [Paenibacillus antri]
MTRIPKPKKPTKLKPKPEAIAKHPMALPGMRWIPTAALSPANLLQLQRSAGNQAVARLLKRFADPETGSLETLKTYHAARRDGVVPVPGAEGEALMEAQDPRFGDWRFQFVAGDDGGMAMYWITLGQYKHRQRHILIDAATNEPLEVTGGDLDERDRQLLADWAAQLLLEQLSGAKPALAQPAAAGAAPPDDEEEDFLGGLLADDGGDEGGGSGLGAAIAAAAARSAGGKGKGGGGKT